MSLPHFILGWVQTQIVYIGLGFLESKAKIVETSSDLDNSIVTLLVLPTKTLTDYLSGFTLSLYNSECTICQVFVCNGLIFNFIF